MKVKLSLTAFILFLVCIFLYINNDTDKEVTNDNFILNEISRLDLNDYANKTTYEKIDILESDGRFNSYVIRDIARYYFLTKDVKYKEIALDLFDIYVKNFKVNGILQPDYFSQQKYWYRDTFTREMFLLVQSYEYLDSDNILREVEEQVNLWMKMIDRREHNGFLLYPYGINLKNFETEPYEINPNQNLAVARLFSTLYFNPKSIFFKNFEFKNIVFNEVNAALSLVNPDGSIPLRENLPYVFDSNYAGLATTFLYNIVQMWALEDTWKKDLQKIGLWIYKKYPMSHPWNTPEDFPNFRAERFYAYNLIGRLVSFYYSGVSSEYARSWVEFIKNKFPEENLRMETRWMEYRDIPRSYYLSSDFNFNLPPKFYISHNDKKVMITVVSESSDNFSFRINYGDLSNNHVISTGGEYLFEVFNLTKSDSALYSEKLVIEDKKIVEINILSKKKI